MQGGKGETHLGITMYCDSVSITHSIGGLGGTGHVLVDSDRSTAHEMMIRGYPSARKVGRGWVLGQRTPKEPDRES